MKVKNIFGLAFASVLCSAPLTVLAQDSNDSGWNLVWSDEFDTDGKLNPEIWNYENGFQRNKEDQWYQADNAYCKGGSLIIEARKEKTNRKNPDYEAESDNWAKRRQFIDYTSSSVTTAGKKEFLYGRLEVRAKIPTASGAWPAIWLLGNGMEWPSCGEIDVMEYYQIGGKPHILANACWGTDTQWNAKWNSKAVPFAHFTDRDPQWAEKFHVWRMDWDENAIRIYLDDELLNDIPLSQTVNGKLGKGTNPFTRPQYILLNLALGGINGGKIDDSMLPMKYEIDYVRVYEKVKIDAGLSQAVSYSGNQVTSEGAWCWFADPRAIHHESKDGSINKTYIGYIDVHGSVKAMQYDFITKEQEEVLVRSYFQPDDHNNPTFLVLPDDRIMIFYSRHTDEPCFYYRVSAKPGDITTLGGEKVIKTENNTTYPSPFILSDDPNHFYLCWRGINWHPTIAKITLPDADDNVEVAWGPYQMVQSTGARPYAKYASNGKDKIYLTYTTGHPDNEMPNYLYFNYVDINRLQLEDICGNTLKTIAGGPFKVNKKESFLSQYPQAVVDSPNERDWVFQVAPDKTGNPVIAMVRISGDKKSHDYYYIRWNGEIWTKTFIGNAGGHFHQSPELEHCYSAGMAIDPEATDIVYCSMPVKGKYGVVYEIFKYVIGDDGKIASREQLTFNSQKNNVRPYVVANSTGSPLRLTWMSGDYYDWIVSKRHPEGYCTALNADFKGFVNKADFEVSSTEIPVVPQEKVGKYKFKPNRNFALTTTINVDDKTAADGGCLLKLGKLSYWLDGETNRPEVRYKDKVYRSTNVLGNADSWRDANRSTNGKWYSPAMTGEYEIKMKYNDGRLSVYRDGMLDQQINIFDE